MLYLEDLKSGNFTERQIQDYFCTLLDQKEIIYHYESRTNTDHRADVARYYKQAYQPLNDYGYKSGSGQYHTAAINFQRMADAANNECLKVYGENMATSALNADEVLKRTRNHQTAWKQFTSWQLQSWDEAEQCQSEIMAIK